LLHLVQRGGAWAGWGPAQAPPRCAKCNSPPINGQCTNFTLSDVSLQLPLDSKGLINTAVENRNVRFRAVCGRCYVVGRFVS